MKLTFLKSPSDRTLKGLSIGKDNARLYIKKELLQYLGVNTEENGQISIASVEGNSFVIIDNPYYNNFRYTIFKEGQGNPFIYVKGSLDWIKETDALVYELGKMSIGDKEDVPYILVTPSPEADNIEEVDA